MHIKSCQIEPKLSRNVPWMVLYLICTFGANWHSKMAAIAELNCIFGVDQKSKMAATAELSLT